MEPGPEARTRKRPPRPRLTLAYSIALLGTLYVSVFLFGNSRFALELAQEAITGAIPGRVGFGELRLGAGLTGVSVFGVEIRPPGNGPPVIEADEVYTAIDPIRALEGAVVLPRTEVVRPRVLVGIGPKGEVGMERTFVPQGDGDPRLDENGSTPVIELRRITLRDGRVLIHLADGLSIRLDGVQVWDGAVSVANGDPRVEAQVRSSGGVAVVLPELMQLVDPKDTFSLRRYRTLRHLSPWHAMSPEQVADLGSPDAAPGALVLPLGRFRANDFSWADDGFSIVSVSLEVAGERLEARGRLAIADDKRETITFSTVGALTLSEGSPILRYFAGESVRVAPGDEPGGRFAFDIDGSLAAIGGVLSLDVAGLDVAGWPIDRLVVEVGTRPGEAFELQGRGLQAEVADGLITGHGYFDPADGTYALDLWLDGLQTLQLVEPAAAEPDPSHFGGLLSTNPPRPSAEGRVGLALHGDLDGKRFGDFAAVRLEDPAGRPSDTVAVEIGNLTWARRTRAVVPFSEFAVSGRARLTSEGRLRLEGLGGNRYLSVRMDDERINLRGGLDLLTERFDDLQVSGSTRALAQILGTRGLEGRASAALRLRGPLSAPEVRVLRLDVSDLVADGVVVGSASTSGDVTLAGDLPRVTDATLSATDLAVDTMVISEVSADYSFDGAWLRIRNGQLETDFGRVEVDGGVRLFDDGRSPRTDPDLDLQVRGEALDLGALLPDLPVAGSLSVDTTVGGSAAQPSVRGAVALRDAIVFDEWVDSARAEIDYSPRGTEVSAIEVAFGDGRLTGDLHLDARGNLYSARLGAHGFRLEDLQTVASLPIRIEGAPDIFLEVIPADRIVVPLGLASARPDPGRPDVQGHVIVRDFRVGYTDQGAIAFTVDTYGDSVVALGQIARVLDTRIAWPFEDGEPIEINARFDRVELEGLSISLADFFSRGEANGGELDAEIRLGERPDVVADLSLSGLWLQAGDRRFETARPIHVSYSMRTEDGGAPSQHLSIDEFSFGSEQHYLALSGDLRDWETVNVTIDGEAPFSLARAFDEVVADATGVASVTLFVEGTLDDPVAHGEMGFVDATLTPRGLGDSILLRHGRIELTPPERDPERGADVQYLRIANAYPITGQLFGGSFELTGVISLDHYTPYALNLALLATSPTYRIPGEATVTFSLVDLNLYAGDLDAEEQTPLFFLSGNVEIQEAVYFKDYGGDTGVASRLAGLFGRQVVERYVNPIWRQIPELEFLQFEVGIRGENNVFVRNNVLSARVDAELRLDLTLSGTVQEPLLEGEVQVTDGEVGYQTRTFAVQSCTVTFEGGAATSGLPAPRLEGCVAETTIRTSSQARTATGTSSDLSDSLGDTPESVTDEYTIRVTVEGQLPDQLDLTLESRPPLDRRDILALILTGQTLDALTARGVAGRRGLELVVGEVVNLLEANLQDLLAVDELVVIPSSSGEGTVIQVREEVSQRLTVDVGATVLSEEENQQNVRGQITLFDWLMLELYGSSDQENSVEAGGRVRLRLEL